MGQDNISQNVGQFFSKLLNFITQYGLSHILPQPSNIFTHLHFTIWVASVTFRNSGGKTRCMLSFLGSSPTPSLWLDHRVEIRHSSELYLGIQISSTGPTKCCLKHLQCICCCLFKNLFSTSFGKSAGISTEMGFNSYPNSS